MYIKDTIIKQIKENNIEQLFIRNQQINKNELELLKDILKTNTSINLIDFTNSYIEDIKPLIEIINTNNIKIIDFTKTEIKNIEELFNYLTKQDIKQDIKLDTLEFFGCNLKCSKEFLDFIKYNKNIKNINLSSNPLLNNINFYDVLKYSSLQEIYICENNINDDDLNNISNMLKVNKSIKSLYICANNIKNISSLYDGLKNNDTLKFLDLSHNKIEDINNLKEIFENNDTLKYISFCDNKINKIQNEEELNKLIKEKNIEFNINDNPINDFIKYYIVSLKYFNKNDYYIYITGNNKLPFYGSDIKDLLKNKKFNENNLISILKFNSKTNILTIYSIDDNNLICHIKNEQLREFRNKKYYSYMKYPISLKIDLEEFNNKYIQFDILNDYIYVDKKDLDLKYKDKYFIVSFKQIFDFSENDIYKSNYSFRY